MRTPETQVWIMPADGGEAEALTEFPGGVADFDWSPDSARLAVIADDPERPEGREDRSSPSRSSSTAITSRRTTTAG